MYQIQTNRVEKVASYAGLEQAIIRADELCKGEPEDFVVVVFHEETSTDVYVTSPNSKESSHV